MALSCGPRLSEAKYTQKLFELYERSAIAVKTEKTSESVTERNAMQELELHIDYKLGVSFPEEKRALIRALHRKVQQCRKDIVASLTSGEMSTDSFATEMEQLQQWMVQDYSEILNTGELKSFLDIEPGAAPLIPIDPNKINF